MKVRRSRPIGSRERSRFNEAGAIRPDDVLQHGLRVKPLVDLDAIVELQDRLVDLGCPSATLVGKLLIVAVVAVSEGNAESDPGPGPE